MVPSVVLRAKNEDCPTPVKTLVPPSALWLNSVGEEARAAGILGCSKMSL